MQRPESTEPASDPPFGPGYAGLYDRFYEDKPYKEECALLVRYFERLAVPAGGSVLDLGCGTGGHAYELARRGYAVTGIDRSAAMIGLAQAKPATAPRPRFRVGDIRTTQLEQRFAACICMFAVLGYQLSNEDVAATLRNARAHLAAGGVLIFDCWYGPAVLAIRPSDRERVIEAGDERIVRSVRASLQADRQQTEVEYLIRRFVAGRVVEEVGETHTMRFFFPLELAFFLEQTGFRLEELRAFPNVQDAANEACWNALAVALAV